MKKILQVFKNDITKIAKTKIAVVILVGLLFIPGIYAWLNIDSNWNPYDNTGNLPIAIVNKDQGFTMLNEEINMGDLLVESLKTNTAMKWIFTDEEDAKINVDKSKYYGAIIIPEDFSSRIATIFDETEIKKPKFDFYVNQKKNPIAPIIVNKAVGTIQTNLNQAFVNAVVYNVVDKAEEADVITKGNATTEDVIVKLNNAKNNIGQLRTTLDTLAIVSNTASSALSSVKDMLPTVKNITDSSTESISNMKDVVKSFNSIYTDVNKDMALIIETSETITKNIKETLNSTDTENITTNLTNISTMLSNLENVLTKFYNMITSLNDTLKIPSLEEQKELTTKALDNIKQLQKMINDIGTSNNSKSLEEIKAKTDDLNNSLQKMKTQFNNTVEPSLNKAFSNASASMNNVTNLVSNLNSSLGKSDSAMENMIKALNNTEELTNNLDTILVGLQGDIDKIIATLGGTKESELYLKIVNLLQNSPNDIADFISTPVETNEIDIYEIESYGSKMAPFYTVLASWVGCTLLVSILKTNIKKEKELGELKPYQEFFGRFVLFGILAILQGLVIGIGDIILGIQVINWPLFLLTTMLTSLVFMLIVYSLTISFGKVGEATAVVIMVLQVAGSGGTFPIELLPRFFQILQPYMPFYPAMNALRETIGGFYGNNYIMYIMGLLCHTIIPLIIGLILRKPIMKMKAGLSEKLEETDIIV